jgi:16S rRNA (cytosine967-C5)-methyltransferase
VLAQRQGEILAGVASIVKIGAVLGYLTCSLEPEENERQVDRFLEQHPNYRRDDPDLIVLPGANTGDGGFAARLRRAA